MSLKNYIENKTKTKIIFCLENYKQNLFANISGLLLKPNEKIEEARKQILNILQLELFLSEASCPFSEEMQIAIKSNDIKKIKQIHEKFRNWSKSCKLDENIFCRIDNSLFDYQSKFYSDRLNPEDIDKIVESYFCESQIAIKKLCNAINFCIDKIPNWGHHTIKIEAINQDDEFVVSKAKINIGDYSSFVVKIGREYNVENLNCDEKYLKLKEDTESLKKMLEGKYKSDKILTLYISRPLCERKFFESSKRDVCMGLVSTLPKHITLKNMPIKSENEDLWKIKVEEKNIYEILNEGDFKEYQVIDENCSIKWLERVE